MSDDQDNTGSSKVSVPGTGSHCAHVVSFGERCFKCLPYGSLTGDGVAAAGAAGGKGYRKGDDNDYSGGSGSVGTLVPIEDSLNIKEMLKILDELKVELEANRTKVAELETYIKADDFKGRGHCGQEMVVIAEGNSRYYKCEKCQYNVMSHRQMLESVQAENKRLREALKYYADPFTYRETTNAMFNEVPDDDVDFTGKIFKSTRNAGKRAREALKDTEISE